MLLFFALLCLAFAIAGTTAFVIFWPLTLVHLRDKHPALRAQLGDDAFLRPAALGWLLAGRYRAAQDRGLSGLATPARLSLLSILFGSMVGGLLWLLAKGFGA
jgi:hypothetical protein